ncbi:MAG: serine/threonine protein kinase [Planctomycetota bacterium]|nr:MAG: serine/threonine protein kinase [Planctomycetota bacterium]
MTRVTEDCFFARFPVTCREYLEFLNDLCAQGRIDEARRRAPRDSGHTLWIEEASAGRAARFRLPRPDERPAQAWEAEWPVMSVDWHDGLAYCGWRSTRDGIVFTLPHDEEFEKAGRGLDRRDFPYGPEFDAAYSHTSGSRSSGAAPLPVGSSPEDESPYGVRDLSGGASTWTLNGAAGASRSLVIIRGGAWSDSGWSSRLTQRRGSEPETVLSHIGLRLVARPVWHPFPH